LAHGFPATTNILNYAGLPAKRDPKASPAGDQSQCYGEDFPALAYSCGDR
jgi:hypothetical protein